MLRRASDILSALDAGHPIRSLADLSRTTGLPRSTTHRMCAELVGLGLLERVDGGYRLGLRLFELGELVPRQRGLRETALPYMEDLRAATGATVHLGVLEGVEVVYLQILRTPGGPRLPSRIGGRLPAHATGLGKAMLAYSPAEVVAARVAAGLPALTPRTIVTPGLLARELSSIRERGVALDREESTLGLLCTAAPVLDGGGHVVGAISVSGISARLLDRSGLAVRTAALALGRRFASS